MAPDVLARKLRYLQQLLEDLAPYQDATAAQIETDHYKVERILELMVGVAIDVLFHLLSERDVAPASYRDAFRLAGEHDLLPSDLAERLQRAAGMRNILVHLYEEIDYEILRASIGPALRDFRRFVALLARQLPEE